MKRNVLIIGAGGVAHVTAFKCAQNNHVLGDINIASRTKSKCEAIVAAIHSRRGLRQPGILEAHALDALDIEATKQLIRDTKSEIVINVGTTFLNMSILQACIETNAAYIDTAIHENPAIAFEAPPWYANHEWKRAEECSRKGITAILGAGFDPGVVNAYVRLAQDEYFDTVSDIDIIDINAGSHGRYFATNFDPEINLREFTGPMYSWQAGKWQVNKMFEISREFDLPVVGRRKAYLCGHDEIHSLAKNMPDANIRFWMGFGDHYVNVFTVLNTIGLLSEKPVITAEGNEIVPLKVVKACLPDPASLAKEYVGKTCIGSLLKGMKDGRERSIFIYNIADHGDTYEEVGSQAISYTAGVPTAAAALLVAEGGWDAGRMVNVEELPARLFIATIEKMGLRTFIDELDGNQPAPAAAVSREILDAA